MLYKMEDEKLIQLVQENRLLFDKTSPLFRNKNKKLDVWMSIAAELGCTSEQCIRRWTSLRDRYTKLCREQNCPSGSGANEPPVWHLFDQLAFLSDHIKPRQTICSQPSRPSSAMSFQTPELSPLSPEISPFTPEMSPTATSPLSSTQSVFNFELPSSRQPANTESNKTSAQGRKRRNTDCVDKALMSALGTFENRCKLKQNSNKKLEGFAMMLAAMIEELPQPLHAKAMTDAMNAVSALQNVHIQEVHVEQQSTPDAEYY